MSFTQQVSKSKGITTGVGICVYFSNLFEANELAPKKKKINDRRIAEKVAEEFPERESAQSFLTGEKTVNDYRNRYNKGIFTRGVPPKQLSLRYNKNGQAVDVRTGRHNLFPEEIRILRRKHDKFRQHTIETKFKEDEDA